jgi:hypothetical protein
MSTSRRRRLTRTTADHLLRGGPASPPADGDVLASLLLAAAAPPHDRELAGEADAAAAFRQAHLSPAPQPRRPSMSAPTKLLAVKAVLAAMGITGGGVALAAATGHLPSQPGGTPAAAGSAAAPAGATATPPASATAGGSPASDPAASPSPSLRGLCLAYTAGAGTNRGKAPGNPAFTALITAAGGKDKVAAFCTSLLAAKPGHAPTPHPTGKPSSLPSQAPTAHPTGKPTTIPAAHPTGKPTSRP